MRLIPVLMMAAFAVASCGAAKKTATASGQDKTLAEDVPLVVSTANKEEVMKKPDVDVNKVDFSMEFLKTALQQNPKGNTVLSPYSAGMAFSMLTDGARDATRDELIQALCRSSYHGEIPFADSINIVKTANSIWLNHGFIAKEEYLNTLRSGYNAQVYAADAGAPFTAEAVNAWCGKHTEGLIPNIIDEIPSDTRMMLLNALYFKAPWMIPFMPEDTYKEVFHGEKGDADVDFMHKTSRHFRYRVTPDCKYISLPYKDGRYAMLIVVPEDMEAAINSIKVGSFKEVLSKLRSGGEVVLSMPKFKVEYTRILNSIMKSLGAGRALTPAADLSGITDEPVFVTKAIQKCVLDVNEEGAEAAAVTAILVGRTAVAVHELPVVIKVDKPFLFAIYDTKTQMILFEGKIADI